MSSFNVNLIEPHIQEDTYDESVTWSDIEPDLVSLYEVDLPFTIALS